MNIHSAILEQLIHLTTVTAVGNLISKSARDHLVNNGLVESVAGFCVITQHGIKVLDSLGLISTGQRLVPSLAVAEEAKMEEVRAKSEADTDALWLSEFAKRALRSGFSWEDKDGEFREDAVQCNVDALWNMAYKAGCLAGKVEGLEAGESAEDIHTKALFYFYRAIVERKIPRYVPHVVQVNTTGTYSGIFLDAAMRYLCGMVYTDSGRVTLCDVGALVELNPEDYTVLEWRAQGSEVAVNDLAAKERKERKD